VRASALPGPGYCSLYSSAAPKRHRGCLHLRDRVFGHTRFRCRFLGGDTLYAGRHMRWWFDILARACSCTSLLVSFDVQLRG
jgi:hypothetical protein